MAQVQAKTHSYLSDTLLALLLPACMFSATLPNLPRITGWVIQTSASVLRMLPHEGPIDQVGRNLPRLAFLRARHSFSSFETARGSLQRKKEQCAFDMMSSARPLEAGRCQASLPRAALHWWQALPRAATRPLVVRAMAHAGGGGEPASESNRPTPGAPPVSSCCTVPEALQCSSPGVGCICLRCGKFDRCCRLTRWPSSQADLHSNSPSLSCCRAQPACSLHGLRGHGVARHGGPQQASRPAGQHSRRCLPISMVPRRLIAWLGKLSSPWI